MRMRDLTKELAFKFKFLTMRPNSLVSYRKIIGNEYKNKSLLQSQMECDRQAIVQTAYEHSAFYRRIYANVGFEPGDMGHDGWFEKLPIVTKDDLRNHFDEFINNGLRKHLRVSTTGGSTGTPTKTGYDGRIVEEIYSWRLQHWFGVYPWDDHAYVWRDTRSSRFSKIKNSMMWWPTRHLKMDATFITEDGMLNFIRKYNILKPAMLQGYVGAITQLAQFIVLNKLSVHRPKFVWTTSAPLPESQRRLIGQAFNAPVCDQYGSCEIRWIAAQCPECLGLHVNTEHVSIEFVNIDNKPVPKGEYGKALLTNLEDTVFPLIRYENGDRGRWLTEECPCGRVLPLIDSIKGRETESFVLPSGKTINGEFLTTIFDSAPEMVHGFRVVQHRDLSITIEYIPAKDERSVLAILNTFAEKIKGEVQVNLRKVSQIAHDRGKLRFVVREN